MFEWLFPGWWPYLGSYGIFKIWLWNSLTTLFLTGGSWASRPPLSLCVCVRASPEIICWLHYILKHKGGKLRLTLTWNPVLHWASLYILALWTLSEDQGSHCGNATNPFLCLDVGGLNLEYFPKDSRSKALLSAEESQGIEWISRTLTWSMDTSTDGLLIR